MSELAAAPGRRAFDYLLDELAPRPGRLAAVVRTSVCCMLVVAIGMLYQIPLVGYMAYAVFLLGSRELASTMLTGIVAVIAFTIAVLLSLLFYTLDADEPALRLPLMALSTFVAIFLAIFFLVISLPLRLRLTKCTRRCRFGNLQQNSLKFSTKISTHRVTNNLDLKIQTADHR